MDEEFTTEAECPACSKWPSKDKDCRRSQLREIPLQDPICKACFASYWSNISGIQFTEDDLEVLEQLEMKQH